MLPQTGPSYPSLALRACARFPGRIAFRTEHGEVTYADVADYVGRAQAVLLVRGMGRGHRLALLSTNRWETWCVALAAQALGATITWLHPMGSLEAQLFQLQDSEATLLLVDADGFGSRG